MEYTTLGSTGIEVSEICLRCMSFGTGSRYDWALKEEESRPIIERAIDLGINFFDTANIYQYGGSERALGNVLADYDRDAQVAATKVYMQIDEDDTNSGGLSRKTIEQQLSASLDRLGMETIDLYQIHHWDYELPLRRRSRLSTTPFDEAISETSARVRCGPTSSKKRCLRGFNLPLGVRFGRPDVRRLVGLPYQPTDLLPHLEGQGVHLIRSVQRAIAVDPSVSYRTSGLLSFVI